MKRVAVAPGGIFHSPLLMRILNNKNFDLSLYSAYPRYYFKRYLDFKYNYYFIPMPFQSLEKIFKINIELNEIDCFLFDYFFSKKKLEYDYFHGWAGYSYLSMKKLIENNKNTKIFLERSCPHIDFQEKIIKSEYEFFNLDYKIKPKKFIEKCKEEYDLASKIVVPSKYSANSFYKTGFDKEKIYISSLSYKFEIQDNHIKQNHDNNIFKVCSVGGNAIRKGFYYLVKAWSELNLKNSQLNIRTDLKNLKKNKKIMNLLNKTDSIKIIDKITNMKSFYNEHSLFCLTSIDEGFGMVVTEALSCGLPVIISENVGSKDIFENFENSNPQIYKITKIRDIEGIKNAISYYHEIFNNKKYEELDIKRRNFIKNNFSKDGSLYNKKINQLYE